MKISNISTKKSLTSLSVRTLCGLAGADNENLKQYNKKINKNNIGANIYA